MHSNQDVNRKMFFYEYCEIETKNLKHLCILLATCEEIENWCKWNSKFVKKFDPIILTNT